MGEISAPSQNVAKNDGRYLTLSATALMCLAFFQDAKLDLKNRSTIKRHSHRGLRESADKKYAHKLNDHESPEGMRALITLTYIIASVVVTTIFHSTSKYTNNVSFNISKFSSAPVLNGMLPRATPVSIFKNALNSARLGALVIGEME